MSNLLQRLLRTESPAAPGPRSASSAPTRPPRGRGAIDVFFLWDRASPLDRQQLPLAIDTLAWFGGRNGTPLQVDVVHRDAIDPEAKRCFDGVPNLWCEHRTLAPAVAREHERAMGHRWREFAALAVSRIASTSFYLVMDESCICARPLEIEQLTPGGKAISQFETLSRHPESLEASQQLLGIDLRDGDSISTLPAILHTETAQRTLKRVANAGGTKIADERLAAASADHMLWTACSLYSASGQAELHRHHLQPEESGRLVTLHGDANVWGDDDDLTGWDPVQWVQRATHGQFIVAKCGLADRARVVASRCYALMR